MLSTRSTYSFPRTGIFHIFTPQLRALQEERNKMINCYESTPSGAAFRNQIRFLKLYPFLPSICYGS
jgi:hypothetical protein